MIYFLDTNICIYTLKDKYPPIKKRVQSLAPDRIKIPSIVKAELLFGALKSEQRSRNHDVLERFLDPFEIIPFSDVCAEAYSKIRLDLESKGQMIGPNDIIIAATVFAHHGILVTNNVREYSRILNLKIQDWTHEN